ncbi:4'-phosphopantetheinyl transferase family protein [Acidimangrovimonas pyrenivorans]|uniref:4'-phosphopantetheinyl transferase family protein n=1 Tax=Acidimangrovimonas pyrenivorans TaxID=2030798 RepID=A0ABV7ABS8_9RHOB
MEIVIDLWLWPLTGGGAHLSPDEAARADRFVYHRHAEAFRAGRSRLREILAGYRGMSPAALRFSYSDHGRPSLAGGPEFNLSHSGGWAALAVSERPLRLGIDIEAHRTVEEGIARRFFSPAEQRALAALPGAEWQAGFFRCWTRKEALVKACGPGLSMALDSFDVTLAPGEARLTRIEGGTAADWALADLDVGPGMAGAVAAETGGATLRLRLRQGSLPLPAH